MIISYFKLWRRSYLNMFWSPHFSRTILGIMLYAGYAIILCQCVIAEDTNINRDNIDKCLSQLENTFFEHQYENESDAKRLNRLERFIFGTTKAGSIRDRLTHILISVPAKTINDHAYKTNTKTNDTFGGGADTLQNNDINQSTSADQLSNTHAADRINRTEDSNQVNGNVQNAPFSSSGNKTTNAPIQTSSANAYVDSSNSGAPFDYTSYPRVNTLEEEMLGQTFPNDTLSQRVARLETKTFGTASTSNDLCQRVDMLDKYAERHDLYGERKPTDDLISRLSVPIGRNTDNFNSGGNLTPTSAQPNNTLPKQSAPIIGSTDELVAMMEAELYNHTYPSRRLIRRVKKLENRVLPKHENNNANSISLDDRIARLWDTLHPADRVQLMPSTVSNNQYTSDAVNQTASSSTSNESNQVLGARGLSSYNTRTGHHPWLHKLASAAGAIAGGVVSGLSYGSYYGSPYGYGAYGMGMPRYGYGSPYYGGGMYGLGSGMFGMPGSYW
jgi:hypothetical protein